MTNEKIDIAIVGGGVSGVYSAWKLKQRYPEKKIVVFEASDHVGGRLLSVKPPDIDNMMAELGGMRIIENTQPLIVELLKELNDQLPVGKKIETYDFPVDEDQNIAYLRGIYLRLSDFIENPDKVPYKLSFLEKGGTPGSIITNAINQIVPGITSETSDAKRREMARNASFDGIPLWKQGFWNVLMRVLTGEAYELGVDAGGYNSTLTNWNAADAIPWYLSDFGIAPKYKGFKKGFQIVPKTLAEFFKQLGGEIRLSSKMSGFNYDGKTFELSINQALIQADVLILAMPRRSIDLLTPNSPLLSMITHLTSSVTPQPLFKLFTTYQAPWWRAAGFTKTNSEGESYFVPVESGRSVTDLPVRQTYYWPTDEGKPAVSGPSMLMASYDDGTNIGFWDGFRPQRRQAWQQGLEVPDLKKLKLKAFMGDYESRQQQLSPDELLWYRYCATPGMVQEVSRQLGVIHGMSYTPKVVNAAFRDWGDDPFGGGWNSWNIGVKSSEVKEQIVHPLKETKLYICGEAYSDAQGWVEGALQTAEMMLKKIDIV